MTERRRPGTATSPFGVGRREGHDSSAFYNRFPMPELSGDNSINKPDCVNELWESDARDMDRVGNIADESVALVVTSPPYYTGKEYEEALGQAHVPATYAEYLEMLHDVFAECVRKLEPGGRIAVNVANLGRKPYRSLSADVIHILQDRLKLLLRGEVIWRKANGANGNCAWGSYGKPSNPVLRDLTERIVIASKGRFDRALTARQRRDGDHPCQASISSDEFLEATTDVWEIPPASATGVGHPAPFPVELPQRLIELYTYEEDLILDPFMGSGSTAVAAVLTGRHFVGFDTDPDYIEIAKRRVKEAKSKKTDDRSQQDQVAQSRGDSLTTEGGETAKTAEKAPSKAKNLAGANENFQARSTREGRRARELARGLLKECGFEIIDEDRKLPGGVTINFVAKDKQERRWYFDVSGAFSVTKRPGLKRTDTLWKALGKAATIFFADEGRNTRKEALNVDERQSVPLVLLTTDRPAPSSAGGKALDAVVGEGKPIFGIVQFGCSHDPSAQAELGKLVEKRDKYEVA